MTKASGPALPRVSTSPAAFNRRDKRRVVFGIDRILYDVFRRVHGGAAHFGGIVLCKAALINKALVMRRAIFFNSRTNLNFVFLE